MHDNMDLILTLAGGLGAALVLGYLTHLCRLSPIVGYLLAGICVGPNTPGFVANRDVAGQVAELGVILLMFGVGLHFHFKELLAVWRIAVPGAIFQSLTATIVGAVAARAFGWEWTAGIVYGLALSVASTVVLVRVLADNHDLHTPTGHIAVGWLVVEDLFTVVVLVLLPVLFGSGEVTPSALPGALALAAAKIVLLVVLVVVLGGRLIPWFLERIAATRSRELFTLSILVVALGIAIGSAKLFGVSMALGAFLAGMVVGRSDFSLRAASGALPMQDAFAVLFFVSVGMLFDPRFLLESPSLVLATLAVVMLSKPLAAYVIVLVLGYPLRVALAVAVVLGQVGEFSFILAHLGRHLNILPEAATNALVAASILSISFNPILYRLVDQAVAWSGRRSLVRGRATNSGEEGTEGSPDNSSHETRPQVAGEHRAVVIGYGPVGQMLSRLLRDNEIEPTIVEMNMETVKRLRSEGIHAIYGDASHSGTLSAAGIRHSHSLILGASGLRNAMEIIRLAREQNPKIRVLVRTAYLREVEELSRAGADHVFASEGEIALAMTESLLRHLGATADQIDREKDRVRQDLFRSIVREPTACDSSGLSDTGGNQIMVPTGGLKDEPIEG